MNILAFRRRCCSKSRTYRPDKPLDSIEWQRFPLRIMAKRGWIPNVTNPAKHAAELIGELIERAGGPSVATAALYRKNDHLRVNAKTDEHALKAWCWYVLATANENPPTTAYRPGTVTLNFLKQVARLSPHANGPRRAQKISGETRHPARDRAPPEQNVSRRRNAPARRRPPSHRPDPAL